MTAPRPDSRPLRLLALPRYGRAGASSRLRIWQYLPWLEANGFDVTARPLLQESYIAGLQRGRRNPFALAKDYARQVAGLMRSARFDLLWIEKEALPWIPGPFERALLPVHVPIVLDYDDAVYELYDSHRWPLARAMLAGKHVSAMRDAALVLAGNATLAQRARSAGNERVEIVPTVVDLDRYPAPARRESHGAPVRVCWIGQQSTAGYLRPYREMFETLTASGQARFVAIGIDAAALCLPMESAAWSEAGEVAALSACDIGIMPLSDGPFERGKCGYKLIQYMACGLPVVASPVGANREIVEHGVNGLLADSLDEWRDALSTLAADPALRSRMGDTGRRRVEGRYSLQVTGPVVAELLRSAAIRSSKVS